MLVPHAASTGLSTGASTGTASFDQIAIVTAFVALMYVGLDVRRSRCRCTGDGRR